MSYLSIKSLHIIAIISWMAGLLYLFRLFVYHASHGSKSRDNHELLSLMEQRLYRFITVPAMSVAWLAGLALIMKNPILMKSGWMHGKLLCVVLMTFMTIYGGRLYRQFHEDRRPFPSVLKLKIMNEVPTLLMIIIVIFVIMKPF